MHFFFLLFLLQIHYILYIVLVTVLTYIVLIFALYITDVCSFTYLSTCYFFFFFIHMFLTKCMQSFIYVSH